MALSERELIEEILAPLARPDDGSLGLTDDAALIAGKPGLDLIVTQDSLVEDVHFRRNDSPRLIAQKALRVNLSDLAAKGAEPHSYFLSIALPEKIGRPWLEQFAEGLALDQAEFGISLYGGDTVRARAALMLTITVCGTLPEAMMVRRSTSAAGDRIYVSGTIGDGALGLAVLSGGCTALEALSQDVRDELAGRYLLPRPRVALAPVLREFASAAMDISDGLAGDLGLLARASGVGAEVDATAVLLSQPCREAIENDASLLARALTGGDDYEILCTIAPGNCDGFEAAAREAGVDVTAIGTIAEGQGVPVFRDASGGKLQFEKTSYAHF